MTQTRAQRRLVRLAGSMNAKAARLDRNGRVTPEDLAVLYLHSKGVCAYCGDGVRADMCSFDHRLPFVAGGENDMGNIVVTCMRCNRRKASRLASEYALARQHRTNCEVCGTEFTPRWADWVRGYGRTCSAVCAGRKGRQVRSANAA